MVLLKQSPDKDKVQEQYNQLWDNLLNINEQKATKIIKKANKGVLSKRERLKIIARPLKTHLIWIIPLSALAVAILLYVIFIWVALLVE
ncbi:hypothetical protein [Paenibacillus agri]|uniref:Uncharacterized protein n=1 Tax=Paenibacillus agri TaxID=2744309 RepID=A0A850EKW8_9BACL|nr:hypothetical protein [Paenibacillus agri]NUU61993.1 hypothetical protein [Paenibacillus agri]